MAIAFDNVCPDTSALTVASLTSGSWTVAGANRVAFGLIGTAAGSPTTHTEMRWRGSTGDLLTQTGTTLTVSTPARMSAWRLVAPSAESNTAYGLWGASQDETCIGMVSYTGVDQTTPNGTPVTNTGSAASATGTATITVPSAAGDKILALIWTDNLTNPNTIVLTPGTSADGTPTERYFNNANLGGWHGAGIYEMTAGDSSTIINIDWSSGDSTGTFWGIIAFVINAASATTLEQEGFRFGNDDGAEAAHTWAAADDTNITAPAAQTRLLNVIVNATGTPGAKTFKLQYRKVGDASWLDVPLE